MSHTPDEIARMRLEAARALLAASDQIDLALRESQPQVESLGEALHLLAAAVAEPQAGSHAFDPVLVVAMRQAISRLQFYDRMTQHLTHVQDYLSRSASHIADPAPEHSWTGVHKQLSDKLLSDTQRFHMGRNFPEGKLGSTGKHSTERRKAADPGDIDLF